MTARNHRKISLYKIDNLQFPILNVYLVSKKKRVCNIHDTSERGKYGRGLLEQITRLAGPRQAAVHSANDAHVNNP